MRIKVILNPYANRWNAQARLEMVQAVITTAHLDADIYTTQGPGDGRQAAQKAGEEGYQAVVAAGGDGTISEVINGLIVASGDEATLPFGIFPIGTANDLSDNLGLSRELDVVAASFAVGHTRQIDAVRVNDHYFVNNCALGMEPLVTVENTKIKRLSGNARYVVALIRALIKLKAWQMRVTWDDGQYEGPVILLSVCNGARTGGLFYLAPDAKLDDGLIDMVLGPDMPRLTILTLLPRLLNGSHIHHPKVQYVHARRIHVESNPATPIHADGELFADSLTEVDYEILPGKITLLAPVEIG